MRERRTILTSNGPVPDYGPRDESKIFMMRGMFEEKTLSIMSKGVSPLGQFDAADGFLCVM